MYARATSGDKLNNNKFSICSVRNISQVLEKKRNNCFVGAFNVFELSLLNTAEFNSWDRIHTQVTGGVTFAGWVSLGALTHTQQRRQMKMFLIHNV